MPIDDWTFASELVTPQGSLFFNDRTQVEGRYLLDPAACAGGVEGIRAEKYGIPNADGAYLRRRFDAGYVLHLVMQLWTPGNAPESVPACSSSSEPVQTSPSATSMVDLFTRHARSIQNGGGRFLWTPNVPGNAVRLLDDLWMLTPPVVTVAGGFTSLSCDFDTRFPYAIDFTQTITAFSSGDDEHVLTNTGTSSFWPVWKIYGPCDGFSIENLTTDEVIVGDKDFPGASAIPGGSYLEIDTFRNTAYLNGDGANYLPFIDVEDSTFFPLEVGDNDILVLDDGSGGGVPDVDCLWQNAWF